MNHLLNFSKLFIVLLLVTLGTALSAQQVTVIKALRGFEGNSEGWAVQKRNALYPAQGYIFYEVAQSAIVIVPQDQATPRILLEIIKANENIQVKLFGESYEAFAAKKKKKKPKNTISVVCKSKTNCDGTCYAIIDGDGKFIRCGGNCCESGEGVWEFQGTALETIGI